MVELRASGRGEQRVDGSLVILEFGQRGGFGERQLAVLQGRLCSAGVGHGRRGGDRVAVDGQALGDLGRRDAGQQHLGDAVGALGVGQRGALVVGDDLVGDAFGGRGLVIGALLVEDVHRDGVQFCLARGQGAPLSVAHFDARLGAHGGDGLQDTVFTHAGQEPRVQRGVIAHVIADLRDW